MKDQVAPLTVLFADISSSTGIVKQYGDRRGREIIAKVLDRVAAAIKAREGRVVDRVGDELMCAFPGPHQAVPAALEVQAAVSDGATAGEYPQGLRMRIGLHHGSVVQEGEQIFGDTIHTAKRMVDMAKADQILTTRDTLLAVGDLPGVQSRRVDELRIKGHVKPLSIQEILPEGSNMTVLAGGVATPRTSTGEHYVRCTLRYGGNEHVLDLNRPVFAVGRDDASDLPLAHGCVSREHGRLEYQKGRIIFVDHSTNGTFVSENSASGMVLVHREQRWLRDNGVLRFGARDDADGVLTLEYVCQEG
jgi:class 3 adenylate cyclase